ncbi:hypothetical protein D3C72_2027710 [compost metagenome]
MSGLGHFSAAELALAHFVGVHGHFVALHHHGVILLGVGQLGLHIGTAHGAGGSGAGGNGLVAFKRVGVGNGGTQGQSSGDSENTCVHFSFLSKSRQVTWPAVSLAVRLCATAFCLTME